MLSGALRRHHIHHSHQAADTILLFQPYRSLRAHFFHGASWLHSSTGLGREAHFRYTLNNIHTVVVACLLRHLMRWLHPVSRIPHAQRLQPLSFMYFCRIGGKGKQRYRTRAEASVTSTLHGCRLNTKNLSERAETARKGVIHWYQSIFLCDTQQLHFHPIQCLLDNIKQNREKRGKRERHQMATRQFFLSHGPSRSPSFIVVIYCEP